MAGLQAGDLADGLLEPGGGAARGVQEAGSRAQDRILLASLRLQIFHSPGTMTMMRIMILDILFVNMKRKYNICTAARSSNRTNWTLRTACCFADKEQICVECRYLVLILLSEHLAMLGATEKFLILSPK